MQVRSRRKGSNEEWVTYFSISNAATALTLNRGCISPCIQGKQHQTGGYEFQALDLEYSIDEEEWRDVNHMVLKEVEVMGSNFKKRHS